MDGIVGETQKEPASLTSSQTKSRESEIKSQVDAVWEKMNKGVSTKTLNSIVNKQSSTGNRSVYKSEVSHNWMSFLGMRSNRRIEQITESQSNSTTPVHNGTSDEAKKLAAIALASAKAPAAASAAARGKIEVTEKRDFAGEEVEVKKLIDSSSKEAIEKAGASSAVDAILEQIKKKPKLNLLDKTKKDWGEFKEENRGLEDELDAYKKSSNQYLDKQSFLHRADFREYERERDARLAQQAKRRLDMREDP
ncbi:hypothetical protein RND81_10G110600 [Saponaria officinalis]|uniref:BCNT-C domain-containing protein n=1 Tax=Saponaria officinalis TaxID=3572 RepID=A0AAW1I377_SAPOF